MPAPLPQTLEEAHEALCSAHEQNEALARQNEALAHRIEELNQQIAWFHKHVFGKRSEKRGAEESSDQLNLFADEASEEEAVEEENPPPPERKPRKRRSRGLPPNAPRVDVVIDVTEEEKTCACCGAAKHCIGEDITEQLDIIPARVFVRRIHRPKYACRTCRDGVAQTPLPEQPIKRGIAAPGFLAYMVVAKYADHIPLCRMEKILGRNGIDITRSNMSEWAMQLHRLCAPLLALILQRVLESMVIHSDDTTLRVQQPGGGIKRCYLWTYLGDVTAPYSYYDFREGRSRAGPNEVLSEYRGYLQADAYTGYEDLYRMTDENGEPRIIEVGCWAHARRYFVQADETGDVRARHAIAEIGKLFAIEKRLREEGEGLAPEEWYARRLKVRRAESIPILDKLFAWMDERLDVLPQSPLGKALGYALNNRDALKRYTTDGRLAIDNNAAERALRPIAVGRKNWLFAGSRQGGHAAATFFTLIESAKRNGHNPYDYLRDVFTRLPGLPVSQCEELLPDRWTAPADPA